MKHLLLISLLFATTSLFAQTQKVDTAVTETWNGTVWAKEYRIVNTYNTSCQLTTTLFQYWDDASQTWGDSIRINYTYLTGDYVSEQIFQGWTGTAWENLFRQTYTYDGSYKILTTTLDNWDGSAWDLFSVSTYTYDASGYTDSVLTQVSLFGGPLENSLLSVYDNNSDGTPNIVISQFWLVNAWYNSTRMTYTYNADKTVSQIVTEAWTFPLGPWANSNRVTNTYSAGYLTTSLYQTWSGSAWEDESRTNYTYSTGCTLPLKLISFTASRNNNTITLDWQTAEEVNTSHFTIQRSTDGEHFTGIGNVTAKSNGLQTSYSFTDNVEKIIGDKAYYRLQMFDKDGSYTYSKIVPVTLVAYSGALKVYPNPVKNNLFVLFNIQNAAKAQLRITDAAGKIVYMQILNPQQNNSAVGVNVAALSKGVYHVQVITDKNVQTTKFVKE